METTRDREWIDHLAATILSESVNELPENAMSQFQQHVDEVSTEIDLEWIKTIEICPLLDEFDKGIRELTLEDEKNGVDDSDLLSPPERLFVCDESRLRKRFCFAYSWTIGRSIEI